MILDDCEAFLDLARLLAERLCDRKALIARSFSEATALGERALACDLAILDINLGPDKPSGIDVYQWLRGIGFRQPIFFLTGHARTFPLVAEAERLGDVTVLTKPIPPQELVKVIKGHYAGVD